MPGSCKNQTLTILIFSIFITVLLYQVLIKFSVILIAKKIKPQLSSKAAQEIQVDPPDNKEKWRREGDFQFEIIFILQMQTNLIHIYNHK